MDLEKKKKLTCQFCKVEFSSTSAKNRHLRTIHSVSTTELPKKTKRIICPICQNEPSFSFHNDLIKHLTSFHNIAIKESVLHFRNIEEFTFWRGMENREVDYACQTLNKYRDGREQKIYNCNRTDSKGFVSSAKKRNVKAGGSIRINGTCPSRILVNISTNRTIMTKFVETHVGHTDEPRTKRLSKAEQSTIVEQLTAGVSNDMIIQASRIIQNDKLERINLITRARLEYLRKKFNIDKKGDADDMTATATFDDKREIILQEMNSYACSLDEQSFNKYVINFRKFKSETEQENAEEISKKIKIEEQTIKIEEQT